MVFSRQRNLYNYLLTGCGKGAHLYLVLNSVVTVLHSQGSSPIV